MHRVQSEEKQVHEKKNQVNQLLSMVRVRVYVCVCVSGSKAELNFKSTPCQVGVTFVRHFLVYILVAIA